jgi:catalase
VAQGADIDLERAKALPNLPGHPAPNEDVAEPTYQGGELERQ